MRIPTPRVVAVALAGVAATLLAQTPTAPSDPAETTFAEAMAAHEKSDWSAYRDAVERTVALLHDSSRLLYRLASARLLAGDRSGAIDAFRRMVDASFYRDPRSDPEFAALLAAPAFRAELARLDALLEPAERSTELFRLPTGGTLIEGVAFDAARRTWYLSSVDGRQVLRRDAKGRVGVFAGADQLAAPLGLAIDADRRRLWVVSAGLPQARGLAAESLDRSALVAFDLDSGRRVARIDSRPGKHLWNDLALAADGTLYVSDVGDASVARVGADGGIETLVQGAGLRSPGGLALSRDGRRLYVADWSRGLAALDLQSRELTWLRAPASATTLGADGLRLFGDDLIAIQNGVVPARVTRFRLSPDGLAITGATLLERAHRAYDEPTLGVIVDGALVYVANSHWPGFGEDGYPRAGADLSPALLLRLPLDDGR